MGPSESEEGAFLAEERAVAAQPQASAAVASGADEERAAPLPPMDELVKRIPATTRDLMDELFRARFVTVKRVPRSALKS